MATNLRQFQKETEDLADFAKAKILQRFFKTGKGEYGEGDLFLGITVPQLRMLARKYSSLSLSDVKKLLGSKIHEHRLAALLILVENFQHGSGKERKKIYRIYLSQTRRINNWDLVDLSADKIVGVYLWDKPWLILKKLAHSKNLWERRIAVMATFHFIKNKSFGPTLTIAEILLKDKHDLIHKAVGWMLREIGKRSQVTEERFLKKYYQQMARTMLRYAIERFPEKKKKAYLQSLV